MRGSSDGERADGLPCYPVAEGLGGVQGLSPAVGQTASNENAIIVWGCSPGTVLKSREGKFYNGVLSENAPLFCLPGTGPTGRAYVGAPGGPGGCNGPTGPGGVFVGITPFPLILFIAVFLSDSGDEAFPVAIIQCAGVADSPT